VAALVQTQFGVRVCYEPEYTPPREPLFLPDAFCSLASLEDAMERTVRGLPQTPPMQTATLKPTISLEDMMDSLRKRIEHQLKLRFSDIRAEESEHKNVIVGFLAILELFKQGNVLVTQITRFEEIEIEIDRAGTPRYY
jgi:chromatin segregation and condensation protein Rec8/ScpA/Scc1 (kleisin family)